MLQTILDVKLAADPGFWFNFVDVGDVAEGCWQAAQRGRAGERYLLTNELYQRKSVGGDRAPAIPGARYP